MPKESPENTGVMHDPQPEAVDATWAPGAADPFADDFVFEQPQDNPPAAPEAQPTICPTPARASSRTIRVEDVWGDDLEGVTPCHTLKSPRATMPPSAAFGMAGPIPDLSKQGYELLQVIGEGGVGVVYQAIQKSVDRRIAVKMIKSGVGRSVGEREKFISEAMVTGRLDHPNIVPIHDLSITADGQPFYAMKMVRGTPWSKVIRQKSLTQNLAILLDVCDAVSFAHSKQVIHRDLKPENVMLGEFGEVQLMDWGLGARVSEDGRATQLSPLETTGGTPAYMAPEMVTGEDGPVGTHSDIYLLGGILFEIIAGKPPHAGRRVLETLENAHKNVIQYTEHDGVLLDIALEAMQTKPSDRYASVDAFKHALLDYQSHAESINLCTKAARDLESARESRDYELFAQALFGYRQALAMWAENRQAVEGIREVQLQYAACAFDKGDLDLAASTLDTECAAHRELAARIEEAQQRRDAAKRRLRLFRNSAIALTAAVIVILTVASVWIYSAKKQAVAAKERAVSARAAEAEQRKLAEAAMTQARHEEARAAKALADLQKTYADLLESREQERRAQAEAAASERVATKTRDELARTGMLLDSSWWASDAAAARKAQDAASQFLQPAELVISLGEGVTLAMLLIPPGEFVMGSPPDEANRAADEHLHRVRHAEAFYLGKYELTEAQWHAATGLAPASATSRAPDPELPVTSASPQEIADKLLPALQAYAPRGYVFRLPSEAEWEYACRAGTPTAFHGGSGPEALDSAGWYLSNSGRKVQPVGGKAPNGFGLHDMHGNASELCADQYLPGFYLESPVKDPWCTVPGETPVARGGSVLNAPEHCRSAYRSYVYRKNAYPFLGVRLALVRGRSGADETPSWQVSPFQLTPGDLSLQILSAMPFTRAAN